MSAAVALSQASVALGGRLVLEGVSLSVDPGEVLGVVGANGSGKTTLVRAAVGLAKLRSGKTTLGDRPVSELSDRQRASMVGYLPQDRRVSWNLPAWRVAALGAADRSPVLAHALALETLEAVGMAGLAERGVLDMSGGERARVLLARLLTTGAPLLVADEPAAGLDPDAQFMAMELLRHCAQAGAAVLVTLHDLTLAIRLCDRLAVLHQGRLAALGPPREALTTSVLHTAFGLDGEIVDTPAGPVLAARRLG